MTTRMHEVIPKERNPKELVPKGRISRDCITKERSVDIVVPKRERRPEVSLFPAEPENKPLADFEPLAARVALPSTWTAA